MRIITWNCNMAFRKKAAIILRYRPDILVVPECENAAKLMQYPGFRKPHSIIWFGNNPNKGLAILSYCDLTLELLDVHNPSLQTILPIRASCGKIQLTIFATWANNPNDPDGQYVEQTWKALSHYHQLIKPKNTILLGDFNSNTIWDRKSREGNHSTLVKKLAEKNIHSAYHLHFKQEQGKEKHPTLYLYRHKNKPYHIDYCFLSGDLAAKLKSVKVGRHKFWTQYSDHVPVMVELGE